jgi:hypothetical protein
LGSFRKNRGFDRPSPVPWHAGNLRFGRTPASQSPRRQTLRRSLAISAGVTMVLS